MPSVEEVAKKEKEPKRKREIKFDDKAKKEDGKMSLKQRLEANDMEFDKPDPPKIPSNKMKNTATLPDIK